MAEVRRKGRQAAYPAAMPELYELADSVPPRALRCERELRNV
ncbi:MAG TPA: hypothetical protein VMK13_04745 [Streptosporangiaceae bacterium]|nr:hypothetical protein [Streptosporangiaceae bacterium]